MLNVGVVGLGIGMRHAAAFAAHPGCRLRRLCDLSEDKLTEAARLFPGVALTRDAAAVTDAADIDVVSIASYDDVHYAQAMAALEHGKHIFVEKPLCQFPEQAAAIDALRRRRGLRMSSNLVLRTAPRFVWLRQAIRNGEFGPVHHADAAYLWGRAHKLTDGWRGRMAHYSIIQGAAVHMIDLLSWLVGALPSRVQAMGSRMATAGSGFPFDDAASLLLFFDNGMTATVNAISACVHPHFHTLAVYGTERTFVQNGQGAWLYRSADRSVAPEAVTLGYPGDRKNEAIASFADALLDAAAPPLVSEEDVLGVMRVCFAAEEACRRQCAVPVQPL